MDEVDKAKLKAVLSMTLKDAPSQGTSKNFVVKQWMALYFGRKCEVFK